MITTLDTYSPGANCLGLIERHYAKMLKIGGGALRREYIVRKSAKKKKRNS